MPKPPMEPRVQRSAEPRALRASQADWFRETLASLSAEYDRVSSAHLALLEESRRLVGRPEEANQGLGELKVEVDFEQPAKEGEDVSGLPARRPSQPLLELSSQPSEASHSQVDGMQTMSMSEQSDLNEEGVDCSPEMNGEQPPRARSPTRRQGSALKKKKKTERGLKSSFQDACAAYGGGKSLTAQNLYDMKVSQKKNSRNTTGMGFAKDTIPLYSDAIVAFNWATGQSRTHRDEVTLHSYITLMQMDEDNINFLVAEEDLAYMVCDIRTVLMSDNAARVFRETMESTLERNLNPGEISMLVARKSRWVTMIENMDPIIGIVIMVNALSIGLQADYSPEWEGWTVLEVFFTITFAVELAVKLAVHGYQDFLFGPDRYWNVFDMGIVAVAVGDLILMVLGAVTDINKATLVRLIRLARLTKLVRVLRLRIFKELTLMLNGMLMGLRTLGWAMVFLAFFIYGTSVFLRQTIGSPQPHFCLKEGDCLGNDEQSRSERHMEKYRHELFGTVPRSMVTVFRCITDGCTSVDGTHIMSHMFTTYGWMSVLLYIVGMSFVMFGLFNLIAAIFVENTIESARVDDNRRREMRGQEHLRVAQKLGEVLYKVGFDEDGELQREATKRGRNRSFSSWLMSFVDTKHQEVSMAALDHIGIKITPDVMSQLLKTSEVRNMLDELDISSSCRGNLFDVLDADGSGFLDVPELVQGLMRLRGGAEKSDVIAALLAVRSVQKTVKNMELMALHQQRTVQQVRRSQAVMEENLKAVFPKMDFSFGDNNPADIQTTPIFRDTQKMGLINHITGLAGDPPRRSKEGPQG